MSEIVKTTRHLPAVDHDKVRRLVRSGAVSPLSPEREQAPYLLFLSGSSLQEIGFQQAIPLDILEVTAAHYQWEDKRNAFATSGLNLAQELQKRIAMTLLITAHMAVQRDLADVAAGTKEAKDCLFIPKSVAALQQLTDFVDKANALIAAPDPSKAIPGPQVAVQIVTGSGDTVEVKKIDPEAKAKMLREMASKKGQ